MDAAAAGVADPPPAIAAWIAAASRRQQWVLDKYTPHVFPRWLALGVVAAVYGLRVYLLQGFYIVSYGLAIYVLNLLIGFLTPLADPAFDGGGGGGGGDAGGPILPTRGSDEFRPFVRRLPEFKFWYSITKALFIAFLMTFFDVFDVPVFWPILVFYWFTLFVLTMRKQIKHMIKYKYVPFSFGKQRYTGKKAASADNATVLRD